MSKILKLNIQTRLGGVLLGVGTYDADLINEQGMLTVEQYIEEQKALPLEQRHLPPYFEIIETDEDGKVIKTEETDNTDSYVGKNKNELKDLCKQRGIEYKNNMSNAQLIDLLVKYDNEEISYEEKENRFGFKTSDEFLSLNEDKQVEYLDDIFGLPDDIDEESDDALEYSNQLIETVKMYSALSLTDEVVEKIKEILDYYEE